MTFSLTNTSANIRPKSSNLASASVPTSLFHFIFSRRGNASSSSLPEPDSTAPLKDPNSPSSLQIEKTAFYLYIDGVEKQLEQLNREILSIRPYIKTVANGIKTLATHNREWIAEELRTGKLYGESSDPNIQQIRVWLVEILEKIPPSNDAKWKKQIRLEQREFENNIMPVLADMDEKLTNVEVYILGVENKEANLTRRGILERPEPSSVAKRIRELKHKTSKVKGQLEDLKAIARPVAIPSL